MFSFIGRGKNRRYRIKGFYFEGVEPRVLLSAVPRYDHVVVVMEENHSYGEVIGNSAAPYINSLARQGASFTNSHGAAHPSQPNYLALFSGSTQGVTDDNTPYTFSAENLASELAAAGLSFGGYSQSMPSVGYTGSQSGNYVRKHNPWVDFTNVPSSVNAPFTSFPSSNFSSLPKVSIVVPDLQNDMHDGTIQQGDQWLQNNLGAYATWAKANNSLLVVTWDEDDFTNSNQIPTIMYGANVQSGNYSENINHYNVLRTVEDMFGLTHAANAASATPITDIFTTSTPVLPPSPPPPPPPPPPVQPPPVQPPVVTGSLPSGWSSQDVGSPQVAGTSAFANGTYSITGAGSDIWNTSDQFQFASEKISGDETVIAHVDGLTNSDPWAKGGVMIRDSSAANSAFVDLMATPGNGVAFQWRSATGAITNSISNASYTAPRWIKLVRSGASFAGYVSSDGSNWSLLATANASLGTTEMVGLAVTSHNPSTPSTATFDNVTISGAQVAPTGPSRLTGTPIGTSGSWLNLGNTMTMAMDGNPATFFDAPTGDGDWVGLDLGAAKVISSIRFMPRSGFASRMIGGRFQGSNDGVNYTDLDTIHSAPPDGAYSNVTLFDPTAYRYVRYLSPAAGYGNIAEMEFYGSTPGSTAATMPTYLSDQAPLSSANGWGPIERDTSNGEQAAGDGHTITIDGVGFAKGLGVHAASDVRYALSGNYSTFNADVGVDDEVNGNGSVTFEVWADGVKLYDSGLVTGGTAAKSIAVNVAGKQTLELVVTDGGNGNNYDHADWAGARLT